jgi:hypothetical protein
MEGNNAGNKSISIWLRLTGDPDGDALEDGVEAEGDYEQHAVTEGARVAQHGCGRVIRSVRLLHAKHTNQMVTKVTRFCTLTGYSLSWEWTVLYIVVAIAGIVMVK